jgi:hypothetical protein
MNSIAGPFNVSGHGNRRTRAGQSFLQDLLSAFQKARFDWLPPQCQEGGRMRLPLSTPSGFLWLHRNQLEILSASGAS